MFKMLGYGTCRGRLIKMGEPYPIYDREDEDRIIGYTKIGDMAVVTRSSFADDYHDVTVVSGEYTGVSTLALSNDDLSKSVFIVNNIDNCKAIYINGKEVKFECV